MYRPNFCAECGVKIVRLKWQPWTSRTFCDGCAKRCRKERIKLPLIAASILLFAGFIAGRAGRPSSPPLVIERRANSPLSDFRDLGESDKAQQKTGEARPDATSSSSQPVAADEVVYICGARTKKGTGCSRRVHGPVRCWQHKGMPAMLPQDKLLVKD